MAVEMFVSIPFPPAAYQAEAGFTGMKTRQSMLPLFSACFIVHLPNFPSSAAVIRNSAAFARCLARNRQRKGRRCATASTWTFFASLPAPATSWRRRRRRWGWRRWHSPVMRGRWRWRRHPPSVAVVMVAVCYRASGHASSRCGHCDSGECDCRERRDEFDLVHCRVPFILCASPFSRLHRVRTIRRDFLTKNSDYWKIPA